MFYFCLKRFVHAERIEELRVMLGFDHGFSVDRQGRGVDWQLCGLRRCLALS